MGGDVYSDRWTCGGRVCPYAGTDRSGGAEAAADRSSGQYRLGALPAGDDTAGLGRREPVPAIAQLVRADEDTVRDVTHRFNEIGPACLDPRWAGGRPCLLTRDDEGWRYRCRWPHRNRSDLDPRKCSVPA